MSSGSLLEDGAEGRETEALGRGRRAGGGHTSTAGLARQPLQNQEQMAGRFPDPSFGSDCLGEKGFKLPEGG